MSLLPEYMLGDVGGAQGEKNLWFPFLRVNHYAGMSAVVNNDIVWRINPSSVSVP